MRASFLVLLVAGCLPAFEEVECYSALDCPNGFVCANRACLQDVRDAGVDAGFSEPDAGFMDAVVDAGFLDAQPVDTGATDLGVDAGLDAGFLDALPPDLGTPDTGFDAGTPDTGAPDTGPPLRLTPNPVDFGLRGLACPATERVAVLENVAGRDITVDQIALTQQTSNEITLTAPNTPLVLTAGATRNLTLRYGPTNAGADIGALQVFYEQLQTPLEVQVQGVASATPQLTDTFTQRAGDLDILLVVDNSVGAPAIQGVLADRLTFLFLNLDYEGWNYRIGVTSTDVTAGGARGALIGAPSFVTPATPNAEDVLATLVQLGAGGPADEQPLEAARLAFSAPNLAPGGANFAFYRPSAPLLIILFSDDEDASPMAVNLYATFFEGLKGAGGEDRVSVNAIVSTITLCSTPANTNAYYAGRTLGLVGLTGGVVSSICDVNWDMAFETYPPIPRPRDFLLSSVPEVASIEVRVDNQLVPGNGGANWSFDGGTNQVRFSAAAAPPYGARISIRYIPAC